MAEPTPALATALIAEYFATGSLGGLPADHFVDGVWHPPASRARMGVYDPGCGVEFTAVAAGTAEDVAAATASAGRGFAAWAAISPSDRGRLLANAARLIREEATRLAVIEALESGKTFAEALGDVGSAARLFDYYAGAADKIEGQSIPLGSQSFALTMPEPIGITAHIIPWNYPISTFARSVAPALAAGCAAIVKPAETTPHTALLLGQLLHRAGLPAGLCNVITGTGGEAGAALAAHPAIAHVSFTGSPATGTRVMQAAAGHFARVSLELGGKSPVVVLADADLAAAADGVLGAIFENAGQICSAGSRLVVDERVHRPLLDLIRQKAAAITVGHGLCGHDMGAINSRRQWEKITGFLDGARQRGRHFTLGGAPCTDPDHPAGWFIPPTIIDDLPSDDPCVQEEIFGPVLAVQVVGTTAEALAAANCTRYGLMAGLYTKDLPAALGLARDLRCGQVTVNDYWGGGVQVPFGGTGWSGFGREKGLEALRNFTQVKSIVYRM
jgi:acyl-CoA reductase-like NAD-dependent aldehyde dehydrogenase